MNVLYQNMLIGEMPYRVFIGETYKFENHKHPEIELSYCVSGSYEIIMNNVTYKINEGELAVIGSMISHEFPDDGDAVRLTIEVGPVFLSGYFEALTDVTANNPVLKINTDKHKEIYILINEIIELLKNPTDFSELIIKGDMYKICGYILKNFEKMNASERTVKMLHNMINVEKAFELIYQKYMTPLTVEDVAEYCGYSKSNFCKTFKKITGETFHNVLNNYRVKMACSMLMGTALSIEEIALKSGFSETKTFCRVFKTVMGMTAGEYRKM